MARSRAQAWLKDELILALDLYVREGKQANNEDMQELSDVLRSILIDEELTSDPKFRSPQAVSYKLHNFVALDPEQSTEGFPHGGAGDQEVWDEFAHDPTALAAAANAIRANVAEQTPEDTVPDEEDQDQQDAEEGRILTGVHRRRERNRKIVERKKAKVLEEEGELACEACGFNFSVTYGDRGDGFIECHHTIPVKDLLPGSRTRLADLRLLCSNCHRIVHRRSPWLTMDELTELLKSQQGPADAAEVAPNEH